MKTRTALFLLAATGSIAGGCSSSTAGRSEEATGVTRVALRRMQTCSDLETELKADARAKMNRRMDVLVEQTRRSYASGYGNGTARGGDLGAPEAAPVSGSAPPPNAGPDSSAGGASTADTASRDGAATKSETNTQVKGVDEADIVKSDGKNIFLLHGQSFQVVKAWPATDLAAGASLAIEGQPSEMFVDEAGRVVVYSTVDGTDVYAKAGVAPRAGYADGNAYAGVGPGMAGRPVGGDIAPPSYPGYAEHPLTKITVLALQDGVPSLVRELYFEGSYLSSRRTGTQVRTVLTGGAHGPSLKYWPEYQEGQPYPQTEGETIAMLERLRAANAAAIDASKAADWLPYAFAKNGSSVTASTQRCENLWVPTAGSTEYGVTQVEAIDLASPTAEPKGQVIIGAATTVYASEGAMYLAARGWSDPWTMAFGSNGGGNAVSSGGAAPPSVTPVEASKPQAFGSIFAQDAEVTLNWTHVHKFDLASDPTQPVYVASGTAPGDVKDQFSLDERNGVLRMSTTEQRAIMNPSPNVAARRPAQSNNVFTFAQRSDELVRSGAVVDMAPGEQIYSTRFVGRYGYVVTFRQVDPLFVVDLEDPAQPEVLGELKIPGFSTYMHPLDEGHLLTIGRDADQNGRQLGLALQIFDVSNPTAPRQTSKYAFTGAEYGQSEAANNHKAFTYFADKKLLAFPYFAYGPAGMRSSLEVFDVDVATGIRKRGSVDHTSLLSSNPRGYCGGYYSPEVRRGLFLNDVVYSISYGGVVASSTSDLSTPIKMLPLVTPPNVGGGCAEDKVGPTGE